MPDPQSIALPINLKANSRINPIGLDDSTPRLSWQLADKRYGAAQSSYQIQASSRKDAWDASDLLWDTGRVQSDRSLHLPYGGPNLQSGQQVFWRTRIWDAWKKVGPWSEVASFETGLLHAEDWKAKWIGLKDEGAKESVPCPHLRKEFSLDTPIASGRLYVSARGVCQLFVNGKPVTADRFAPGWTEYDKTLHTFSYDVTELLETGANAIGIILADGWFRGNLFHPTIRANYGDQLSALAQLEIVDAQGKTHSVVTDESWKSATGPYLAADIYDGETYDARKQMPGWSSPGFKASGWKKATCYPAPEATLKPRIGPPVRVQETLKPQSTKRSGPNSYIADFGQVITGVARIKVREGKGKKITLQFAEMLNPDGSLYRENLRYAKATDHYVCRGEGTETYEPLFTYHGFRYMEISGVSSKPTPASLQALVLHSDMEATGSFQCSHPDINQLQSNIVWGQKGNFLELPTDCPQRDERLGWTGDAQVFAPTANFNFDTSTFFREWIRTLVDSQAPDGSFPDISPDLFASNTKRPFSIPLVSEHFGNAGWADAGVICPWETYLSFGDKSILEDNYDAMSAWIDYQESTSHELIRPVTVYGDWLAPDAPRPEWAPTPSDLIGTAYFARTTEIMIDVAKLLGRPDDQSRFEKLHQNIKLAFRNAFTAPSGLLVGDTQTAYLMALAFDLLEGEQRSRAIERLLHTIERRGNHLSTGFLGTPLLCPTLSKVGHSDMAYRVLMQKTYPGWLFPVSNGATTMWERWDSWTPEKGFGDTGMNSFNHYAYGAIGQWLYNTVGGISQESGSSAYKRILFTPTPGNGINWAKTSLKSPYGLIRCEWKQSEGYFAMEVEIPPNSVGEVHIPARDHSAVEYLSEETWDRVHTRPYRYEKQHGIYALPAGVYKFKSQL
ncbi:family 78 glycoside hydrolase catalytic domain [Pelagicoccus sp. NFK12]|uniref:alpha-L-rhamnosidase n=1 Tax=Pelagicoccus enzymogenes TaxID=2773457 RepID=A0A927IJB7_9BACT|nr:MULTISPECIES: alpha-L-rhamnosidase [Pelagicoccus]MBD5781633.1 family 78 glycoside hydrolase catalytic domain [Pelagicoccus enzymogenes]MDQ8181154.1 family 78 glycoside hydrolase catalytic domain [Pelagicoccus sp. SDUM812005]